VGVFSSGEEENYFDIAIAIYAHDGSVKAIRISQSLWTPTRISGWMTFLLFSFQLFTLPVHLIDVMTNEHSREVDSMMDERAFTRMLLENEQMLYRIACGLLRSEEDRRDAIQDAALKAWQNRQNLREEKLCKTWLVRILINECHSIYRKKKREIAADPMLIAPTPEYEAVEIRMMLESLPEKQRIPTVLHYMEGFSLEEISRTLHIPVSLVKSRMHQARKSLRVEMKEEEESK